MSLFLAVIFQDFFPFYLDYLYFLIRKKKNKKLFILISLVFILSEGLIFLSGERLALFFMNLSAVFIIVMINEYKLYRLWTYIFSIILISILLFLFPQSKERLFDQTIYDMTRTCLDQSKKDNPKCINGNKEFYIFSKPHHDMYKTGYKIFLDNKFFGVGPRQFRNKCKDYTISEYSCSSHPHNIYVEILSETGIFSFIILFSLILLIFFYSIKHLIRKMTTSKYYFNDFEICLLSAVIISLWPLSPSGSFFNNWMAIVYFFPVGMLLWQINLKNIKKVK